MLYKNIFEIIGNTPLLEIPKEIHGYQDINIYAKLEYLNPFGSIKDRTAFGLIRKHIDDIKKNKKIIIESSSGNTAKALVSFAGILGTKFKTVSNRIKVKEQKEILELIGAEVQQMPGKSECPDPNDPLDPLKIIKSEIEKNPEKYFYTDQYLNEENINIHYETTGKEIQDDLDKIDYFFAGLGTTGSSRGPSKYIKENNKNLKTIGIVASSEDYIPGIRTIDEMWEVGLYEKDFYEDIIEVSSDLGLDKMQELIRKVGIHVGPTTGGTYAGLLKYIEKNKNKIEKNANIVFIACDSFAPYLSYIRERKLEFFGEQKRDFCIFHIDKKEEKKVKYKFPDEINDNYLMIDIRNNASFKNICIPKSINIEKTKFYDLIDNDNLPFSKQIKILLICPYGKESKKISAFLNMKGYKSFILKGGLEEWIDAGYETENLN